MTYDGEYFSIFFLATYISSLAKCLFTVVAHFKIEFFVLLLNFKSSLYIVFVRAAVTKNIEWVAYK